MTYERRRTPLGLALFLGATALSAALTGCAEPGQSAKADPAPATAPAPAPLADRAETTLSDVADEIGLEVEALQIKASMLEKIGSNAMGIGIEIFGHKAVLTGDVPDEQTQEMAEQVALASEQVAEVDNRLRIAAGDEGETAPNGPVAENVAKVEHEVGDAILETRVKAALLAELGLTASSIEVEASAGEVSLRGQVSSEDEKSAALDTARNANGVNEVIDLLKVTSGS